MNEPPLFSEHDIDILLAGVQNQAAAKIIRPREAYDLQVKLLALIGKEHPLSWEEAELLAKEVFGSRRGGFRR